CGSPFSDTPPRVVRSLILPPFGRTMERPRMRAIVTGQVGMDKKDYLQKVVNLAGERGERVDLYNVGDMRYREAPDVRPGRILDLPLSRLNARRRSITKGVISQSRGERNIILNTHATFRWRHGLFSAIDFDQARALE